MPEGITLKRIIDMDETQQLSASDYVLVDSVSGGPRKFPLSSIQGSGLTEDVKQALLQLAEKVVYVDADGQDYYDDLYDALYAVTAISVNPTTVTLQTIGGTQQLTATTTPSGAGVSWASSNTAVATVDANGLVTSVGYGSATITATAGQLSATCAVVVAQATLTSISAVYTQSGTVYDTDSLDSLKDDLVVTAHWSNGTTSTVASADYTLSGTLSEGTSTITVTYSGKTTTFSVTVTTHAGKWSYNISELTKVTGTIGNQSNATCGIVLITGGANNAQRRSFVVDSGETSMAVGSSDGVITSQTSNYYPVKVPVGATSVTCSITPNTQMIQILTRQLNNGVYSTYSTVGPSGYNVGSVTKTFEPATDNIYMFFTTKYDSYGTSYPVEPTAFNIEFA